MLKTQSIEQFATHIHGAYAFRVTGKVSREDMEEMAEVMNQAFDGLDKVDMLVSFHSEDGSELTAGLSSETIKAQFRAVNKVRNYCVVRAPGAGEQVIEMFDSILPVDAQTFSSEHNALEFMKAQPSLTRAAA